VLQIFRTKPKASKRKNPTGAAQKIGDLPRKLGAFGAISMGSGSVSDLFLKSEIWIPHHFPF
jgi:hypothetical protein